MGCVASESHRDTAKILLHNAQLWITMYWDRDGDTGGGYAIPIRIPVERGAGLDPSPCLRALFALSLSPD